MVLSIGRVRGAPSTIRCIETGRTPGPRSRTTTPARERPAPSGALRPVVRPHLVADLGDLVRERPAPSGALRPDGHCAGCGRDYLLRERPAPSGALRPENDDVINIRPRMVREHPAPSGALRHEIPVVVHERLERSGSTQRHQVHSRPCSKGAGRGPLTKCRGQRSAGVAVVPHAHASSALLVPFCREVRTQGP